MVNEDYHLYWDRDMWRREMEKVQVDWHMKVAEENKKQLNNSFQKWTRFDVAIVIVCLAGVVVLIALLVHYCCRSPTRHRSRVLAPPATNTTRPAAHLPRSICLQQQYATVTVPVSATPFNYPSASLYPADIAPCPRTLPPLPSGPSAPGNNDQPPPYEQVVGNYPLCNPAIHPQ